MRFSIFRITQISYLFALLVGILVSWICYQRFKAFESQNQWVVHTYQVMTGGGHLLVSLKELQSHYREHLLNATYLESDNAIWNSIPGQLQVLITLTGDNPAQQKRIAELGTDIDILQNYFQKWHGYTDGNLPFADEKLHLQTRLKTQIEQTQMRLAGILAVERELLAIRTKNQQTANQHAEWTLFAILFLTTALACIYFWQMLSYMGQQRQQQHQLQELNQELVATNEELTALNEEQHTTNEDLWASRLALEDTNVQLQQMTNQLETQVGLRTSELEQTLLTLQKRNQELDQYVYKVSHDLRAPLTSVMGLVQLIHMEKPPAGLAHYIDLIDASVCKADRFIQSVLSHSKALNLDIQPGLIDFAQLLEECKQELQYMPAADRLHVQVTLNGEADFFSDSLQIAAVLKNFYSNAIKYQNTHREDSYVHFKLEWNTQKAILMIEDNGLGIERQYQNRIFRMFFRASDKSDGSGLGLYIVKQIVERLGGTLTFESELGVGTRFTVQLPNMINLPVEKFA